MDEDRFLTVRDVADLLRLNLLTVYDYIRKGKLTAVKLGRNYRILRKDLDQFIDEHRVKN